MKKLLWLGMVLAVVVLIAAPNSVYVFQPDPTNPAQNATNWVATDGWYKLQSATASSYTSAPFNVGTYLAAPWNGLLQLALYVDTVKTTSATDLTFQGHADTLTFYLEKQTGIHWAVVDTIQWARESAPGTTVERILAANHRLYYFYKTDPTSTASSERPLEGLPNLMHRVRVVYGIYTSVTIKLTWSAY